MESYGEYKITFLVRSGSRKINVEIKVHDGSHLIGIWNIIIKLN